MFQRSCSLFYQSLYLIIVWPSASLYQVVLANEGSHASRKFIFVDSLDLCKYISNLIPGFDFSQPHGCTCLLCVCLAALACDLLATTHSCICTVGIVRPVLFFYFSAEDIMPLNIASEREAWFKLRYPHSSVIYTNSYLHQVS